jgi:hypothetical protein
MFFLLDGFSIPPLGILRHYSRERNAFPDNLKVTCQVEGRLHSREIALFSDPLLF